jgi:hypothetical protein
LLISYSFTPKPYRNEGLRFQNSLSIREDLLRSKI